MQDHLAGRSLPMVVAALTPGASLSAASAVHLASLRCEHLPDPLGSHVAKPRLSWVIEAARRSERQSACPVRVASTPEFLAQDQGDLWDSAPASSSSTWGRTWSAGAGLRCAARRVRRSLCGTRNGSNPTARSMSPTCVPRKPRPVGDLKFVEATQRSPYGPIVSHWKREGETFDWQIRVPPNTTATVHVPAEAATKITESGRPADKAEGAKFLRMEKGAAVYEVGAGAYRFHSGK